MTKTASRALQTLGAILIAASVSACGSRGPLQPPPGSVADGAAKSAEAGAAGEYTVAKPKPHDPFILDPLLR